MGILKKQLKNWMENEEVFQQRGPQEPIRSKWFSAPVYSFAHCPDSTKGISTVHVAQNHLQSKGVLC